MMDDKPLSVPRDIDLHLDTSPITAVDALGNPPPPRAPPAPSARRTWRCPGPQTLGMPGTPSRSPQHGDMSLCHTSAALFPGVPVVRGFCCLLHRRVPLHRGLLLPGGPPEGDEHRGALVPADGHLLRVSFCRLLGRDCCQPPGSGCHWAGEGTHRPCFCPIKSQLRWKT